MPLSEDDDLIAISAIQHFAYCPRQAGLIHLERQWVENRLTAEGKVLHEKTHGGKATRKKKTATARTLAVRSDVLGVTGQCDVVEFVAPAGSGEVWSGRKGEGGEAGEEGGGGDRGESRRATAEGFRRLLSLPPGERRRWRVTPVEYKRGRPKKNDCDRLQVAAQAVCLEEMLGVAVPAAKLFYGEVRRRVDVAIDRELRGRLVAAVHGLRRMIRERKTPPAEYSKGLCGNCSLGEVCLPKLSGDAKPGSAKSARGYLERMTSVVGEASAAGGVA